MKSSVPFLMWFLDEGDGYFEACVAIYISGVITCQLLPIAVMYIFSWGIIHPVTAGIYYCHDWARVKQPGKIIFPPWTQAWEKSLILMPLFALYHSHVTRGFCNSERGLKCIHSHSISPNCLLAATTKTALRAEMAAPSLKTLTTACIVGIPA